MGLAQQSVHRATGGGGAAAGPRQGAQTREDDLRLVRSRFRPLDSADPLLDSRGKRIVYDFPIDNLLMQDPDESPFAVPSPRLLFPAPPVTPPAAEPTISFLDALRTVKRSQRELDYGLPTPAREKDSKRVKRTAAMQDRPSEE